jgi:hypothetical protein
MLLAKDSKDRVVAGLKEVLFLLKIKTFKTKQRMN